MKFPGANSYPWFGPVSVPRLKFEPVRYIKEVEEVPVDSRRSTLRIKWQTSVDSEGKLCLRASWDARRQSRQPDK
jgi:hypothetical protein